jgi:C-terminal processing protease CtpA/Prc
MCHQTGAASSPEIQQLVGKLGAKTFRERETAEQKLLKLGDDDHQAVLGQCLRAYAVSSDPEVKLRAREIMAKLVDKHLFNRPRGYVGLQIQAASVAGADGKQVRAIQANGVLADGSAQRAGMQAGDLILKLDQLDFADDASTHQFVNYIQSRQPGVTVTLTIQRDGANQTMELTLGELPAERRSEILTPSKGKAFFEDWLRTQLGEDAARAGR